MYLHNHFKTVNTSLSQIDQSGLLMGTLTGITPLGESGPGYNSNERVISHFPKALELKPHL